jgi:hypothetical protein
VDSSALAAALAERFPKLQLTVSADLVRQLVSNSFGYLVDSGRVLQASCGSPDEFVGEISSFELVKDRGHPIVNDYFDLILTSELLIAQDIKFRQLAIGGRAVQINTGMQIFQRFPPS